MVVAYYVTEFKITRFLRFLLLLLGVVARYLSILLCRRRVSEFFTVELFAAVPLSL